MTTGIFLLSVVICFISVICVLNFRLVPHQETPSNICRGDRNQSVLAAAMLRLVNTYFHCG